MKAVRSRESRAQVCADPVVAVPARQAHQPFTRSPWFRAFAARMFRTFQKLGVNVTPRHFYWPIPDLKTLANKNWMTCSLSEGVDLQLERQVQLLDSFLLQYQRECNFPELATECEYEFHFNNGFFERVDAEVAYAMVRHFRSNRIIEVGSGNSTKLIATALRHNQEEGSSGELISIEPNPSPMLTRGFPGFSQLIARRVQDVPMELFLSLGPGDILFIDSSHVVAVGSDVVHEYLRILPKLRAGVLVHIHDIFLPADYPEKFVMTNLCFWSEQYMLEAFLSYNHAFEVLWSSSAMQFLHREVLERAFPAWRGSYVRLPLSTRVFTPTADQENVWPCSVWMRKTSA
jgi:Methyltransferase domain